VAETLKQRLEAIKARLAGRATLIAVSKRQPIEKVQEAYDLGIRDFGENTAQELRAKASALPKDIRWHFIGHLQRNKVNVVTQYAQVLHTLDRPELLAALAGKNSSLDLFVQVNIGQEPQKGGVLPDHAVEFASQVLQKKLRLRGLMCIPPAEQDPSPYFASMQALLKQVQAINSDVRELSMGMSGDYETAVRFGATHVRIGEALFGKR
jgi:PLP dependent protein